MKYILSLILLSHVNVGEGVEGMELTKRKEYLDVETNAHTDKYY